MSTSPAPEPEPPITRVTLLDAYFEKAKRTDRVQIRRIEIPAGQAPGMHVHNGPVVGSIVAGSVTFQIDGESASILGPGDVFYEPEDARIARFDAGDHGVTFVAYYLLEAKQEPEIWFPPR